MLCTLKDAPIKNGTRVLVCANLDVAVQDGAIADDFKIREVLSTLKFILQKGGKARIVSFLGRPGGKVVPHLSMKPIAERTARLLKQRVVFLSDPFDPGALSEYRDAEDILFFENIRFWPGEEQNSFRFARDLSRWGDIYINEAFAHSHRAHASVSALAQMLPAYAGLQLEKEIRALGALLEKPARPFVAVLGGAKLETKLPLIRRFLRDADKVLVGGALANTIFALMGNGVGKSAVDADGSRSCAFLKSKKLHLSPDAVTASALAAGVRGEVRAIGAVKPDEYIVDIGPAGRKRFVSLLRGAKTVVWNGPLGYAEASEFAKGTIVVAKAIRGLDAFTVVGGGDTVAALGRYKLLKGFSHVSTGGGAMLEYLSGKKLPGLEALKKKR